MDVSEEYRDKVERIGESTEAIISRSKADFLKKYLDGMLPLALLSLTFVIIFGLFVPVTPAVEMWVGYLNWAVIAYFALRLLIEFRLSDHREKFMQNHWLDFLLIVPAFSVLREARIVRVLGGIEFLEEDSLVTGAFLKEAGIGARITKILKIIKRSLGF